MTLLRYPIFFIISLLTLIWVNPVPDSLTTADRAQIQNPLAPEVITAWNEQAKLTASDPALDDYFGWSVAVSNDTAVIGALFDDDGGSDSGAAYVFTHSDGEWSQQAKLTANDPAAGDRFGYVVAVSGNTAVIGTPLDDDMGSDSGSVYVFTHSGGGWSQQAKLIANDSTAGDNFGWSVAVYGDTAVVGALGDDDGGSDSGSAYVFARSGGEWSQQAKLTASDPAANDKFGYSVAVYGHTAVVGARLDDDGNTDSGSAYVFIRSGKVWSQQAKLTASSPAMADRFGHSVAVYDDTAVVGSYRDDDGDSDSGSAYVFTRSDGEWHQQAKLTAGDPAANDLFGWSVAISGDTAVIGAVQDDDTGINSGSAYVFTRSGGEWRQQTKLTASDAREGDQFGISVSVSGNTAVIGAWYDDDGGNNSGSAYVFVLSYPLTMTLSGMGSGNVVSLPVGIDCRLKCETSFAPHTIVTLTATAETGSTFTGWSGDVSSTTTPITVSMDNAQNITATFALNEYKLTTTTAGNGVGTVSPAGATYPYGTVMTLTATANTGSSFTGWSGDVNSTANPITVIMDGAKAITATFALNEYTIALSAEPTEGGIVMGGLEVVHGQVVTITATSGTGYTFVNWTEDKDVVSTEANYTFTATADRNLVAHFVAMPPSPQIYLPLIMR